LLKILDKTLTLKKMYRRIVKPFICVILALMQVGCSSSYRLNLRTRPSGATVQIGEKVYGTTPCDIKLPKNSPVIKHHSVDVTYTLPSGNKLFQTYNLRKYKPANELPGLICSVFAVPGLLLIAMTQSSEDDQYASIDKDDSVSHDLQIILIGVGLIGIGGLAYYILGGSIKGDEGYDILESF
jgi:hypothetical protein